VELRGARTLITGSTGGLGRAIARSCAERGAHLVLTGRDASALDRVAGTLGAETVVADLAKASDVERLVDAVGDLDVLVSNAALPGGGRVRAFSIEEIDRVLDVNLRVPIVLSRQFTLQMAERGRGHVVFMSSLAAAFPTPSLALYVATKSALRAYSLSLRGELAPHGVGVSILSPGPIAEAGMWANTGRALPAGLRTRSPHDVGTAVVRAIERDRPEVIVAPLPLRLGARVAQLTPANFAFLAPRLHALAQHWPRKRGDTQPSGRQADDTKTEREQP
jgi:short-subunit dehydrogenase